MKQRTYPAVGSGSVWRMNKTFMYRIGRAEGGVGYLGGLGVLSSKAKARKALDRLIRTKKLKPNTNKGPQAKTRAKAEAAKLTPVAANGPAKKWQQQQARNAKNGNGGAKAKWGQARVYQLRGPGSTFMWSYRPEGAAGTWKGTTKSTTRPGALRVLEEAVHQLNTTGTTTHGKQIKRKHNGGVNEPTALVKHTNGEIKKRRAIPNAGMGFGEILGVTLEALQQRHNAESDFLKQMKLAAKQFGTR